MVVLYTAVDSQALAQLYEAVRLYVRCLQSSSQLLTKCRNGGGVARWHSIAASLQSCADARESWCMLHLKAMRTTYLRCDLSTPEWLFLRGNELSGCRPEGLRNAEYNDVRRTT